MIKDISHILNAMEMIASEDLEKAYGKNSKNSKLANNVKKQISMILSTGKQDRAISVKHAQNYKEINKYAIISILKIAKSNITIFTHQLLKSIYSDSLVVNAIVDWMNADPSRELNILLKKESVESNMMIFAIKNLIKHKDKIRIRIAKNIEVKDCNINCLCADETIYKLKIIDFDLVDNNQKNEETIVMNFFDNRAKGIKNIVDELLSDEYSYSYNYSPVKVFDLDEMMLRAFSEIVAFFKKYLNINIPISSKQKDISKIIKDMKVAVNQLT